MKKGLIFLLLPLTLGLAACGDNTDPNLDPNKGKNEVQLTAKEFFANIELGYNIGNTFDAHPGYTDDYVLNPQPADTDETEWGQPKVTKEYVAAIKAAGFDSVRLPVTWYDHVNEDWDIDDAWLARVKEVVDYCIDEEMPVILNLHHDTGIDGWLKATEDDERQDVMLERLEKLWTEIGTYFEDYACEDLAFEGFNEMIDDNSNWSSPSDKSIAFVNEANQKFVDTVRTKTGGNNDERVLICVTYAGTNYGNMISNFQIPTDTVAGAIACEVHAYTPWGFVDGQQETYTTGDISGAMDGIYNRYKDTSVPVLIGEFGVNFNHCTASNDVQVQYMREYGEQARQRGIPIYLWDDHGDFKMIDRSNNTIVHQDILNALLGK